MTIQHYEKLGGFTAENKHLREIACRIGILTEVILGGRPYRQPESIALTNLTNALHKLREEIQFTRNQG